MQKKGMWIATSTVALFGVLSISSVLPGCSGGSGISIDGGGTSPIVNPFLGPFAATVALNGAANGTVNFNVENNGILTGTLAIADPSVASVAVLGGSAKNASSKVATKAIFTATLRGNANLSTGQYAMSGSYVDQNRATVAVTVSGNLPTKVGDPGTIIIQFSGNRFTGSIFNGSLPNPQPSPSPAASPTPTITPSPSPSPGASPQPTNTGPPPPPI